MCIKREELDSMVAEIRSLKALKEETENAIKALEREVIEFMTENEKEELIGNDFKVTYKEQGRTSLDKEKLAEKFNELSKKLNEKLELASFERKTYFNTLKIK